MNRGRISFEDYFDPDHDEHDAPEPVRERPALWRERTADALERVGVWVGGVYWACVGIVRGRW